MSLVNSMRELTHSSNLPKLVELSRQIGETESLLSTFWHLSPNLFCIVRDGKFEKVNPAWETVLGYSEAELIGAEYLPIIHPDDHGMTREVEKILADNKKVFFFNTRFLNKTDNTYRIIEWTSIEDLHTKRIYACGVDRTEELQRAEALKQALLNAPVGAYLTDEEGLCLFINNKWCELTGISLSESIGKGWIAGIHEPVREELVAQWDKFTQELKIAPTKRFKAISFYHNKKSGILTKVEITSYKFQSNITIGYSLPVC